MAQLPPDLVDRIATLLSVKDQLCLAAVSKDLRQNVDDPSRWQRQAKGLGIAAPNARCAVLRHALVDRNIRANKATKQTPMQHEGPLACVAFSPDGRTLATGSWDKKARVFEVATGEVCKTVSHRHTVTSLAWNPTGSLLATASWDRTSRVLRTDTWAQVGDLPFTDLGHSIAWTPDDDLFTYAPTAFNRAPGSATPVAFATGDAHNQIHAMAISPDQQISASAKHSSLATLYAGEPRTAVASIKHAARLTAMSFSPNSKMLATASRDHTARISDAHTGATLATIQHGDQVTSVTWSRDGSQLLTTAGHIALLTDFSGA